MESIKEVLDINDDDCFEKRICDLGDDDGIFHEEDCRKFKFLFKMFYESDISLAKKRAKDDAKDVKLCNRLARDADDRVRSERKLFRMHVNSLCTKIGS